MISRHQRIRIIIGVLGVITFGLLGCEREKEDINLDINITEEKTDIFDNDKEKSKEEKEDKEEKGDNMMTNNKLMDKFKDIKYTQSYKKYGNHNPLITQDYGADPFAMVYRDRVYVYMTHDILMHNKDGEVEIGRAHV